LDPGKSKKHKPNLESLVENLLKPFVRKFHIIFMDSYYSSITLFENLYKSDTAATRIIKRNRKNMPTEFCEKENEDPVEFASNGTCVLPFYIYF